MLTIGELAGLAGTTTRTVRHYHAVGLLPEPARRGNGYREYDARDLLRLLRVRRLTGLGLSLQDVRRVVEGERERDLRALLRDVVADLEQQERSLREQRVRLTALLARDEDPALPEAVADVLRGVRRVALREGLDARLVEQEADLLELLGVTLSGEQMDRLAEVYRAALDDPEQVAHGVALARRFAALAGLDPDDHEVTVVAGALRATGAALFGPVGELAEPGARRDDAVWSAYLATLPAAQRRCLELAEGAGGGQP